MGEAGLEEATMTLWAPLQRHPGARAVDAQGPLGGESVRPRSPGPQRPQGEEGLQ